GTAHARSGRGEEAVPLLERAVGEMTLKQVDHALVVGQRGEVALLAGALDDAARLAAQAVELARQSREQGNEAYALCLPGDVASTGGAEDAEGYYREALALAKDREMRPLVAHCHLGLGKLYHHTDKREQAHEHLATATTMYREMGMTYWLEKAEAEIRELGG